MKKYKLVKNIGGWLIFLVTLIVYSITAEPSAGSGKSAALISASSNLQIIQPPGSPLFLIIGRIFSLFATDTANIAFSINLMAVVAGAFTVMLLYHTITILSGRIIFKKGNYSSANIAVVAGSSATGALAFAFSTSFWSVATVANTYIIASLVTAVIIWSILKWESSSHLPGSGRWIILIAFLAGLSTGINTTALLAIPAVVFVYYFKMFKPSAGGFIIALFTGLAITAFIRLVIPGVPLLFSFFELFFVNVLRLPFLSGIIFFFVLLSSLLVYGVYLGRHKGMPLFYNLILCTTVVLIGYSSVLLLPVRSNANPPLNFGNPDNIFSLIQYQGSKDDKHGPLFYGQSFNAPSAGLKEKRKGFMIEEGRYVQAGSRFETIYDSRHKTFFSRMHSTDPSHAEAYLKWAGLENDEDEAYTVEDSSASVPNFRENLRFFFRYQIGHMYGRYFMWNFAGRQNDLPGKYGIQQGNWISGIDFLDEKRLGSRELLPYKLKDNPGTARYYLLPLLLGFTGFLYQLQKRRKEWWMVLVLFITAGLAVAFYMNLAPLQDAERDYLYLGSFYAFSIWIGLGVLTVFDNLPSRFHVLKAATISILLSLIFVPGLMALQNYDSHNHSGRYTVRDMAYNQLISCDPDAILFTFGSSGSYPLWYLQEVEGIRTDVRVVNIEYLKNNWYTGQLSRRINESQPLPVRISGSRYAGRNLDIVYLSDRFESNLEVAPAIDFILSDDERTKIEVPQFGKVDFAPTRRFRLPVDIQNAVISAAVPAERVDEIPPFIEWEPGKYYLTKQNLVLLDILANNNWERPVFFSESVPEEEYAGLEHYLQLEGMVYRFVPFRDDAEDNEGGQVNTSVTYDNLMNRYEWRGTDDPSVYQDVRARNALTDARHLFARLAAKLTEEGKTDSALAVLDRCMETIPAEAVHFDHSILSIALSYHRAGEADKALSMLYEKAWLLTDELEYYFTLGDEFRTLASEDIEKVLSTFSMLVETTEQTGNDELHEILKNNLASYKRLLTEN